MNLRFLTGLAQPSKIPQGGRELWEVWGAGPTAYSQATGDPILEPTRTSHMTAPGGGVLTLSGNYNVLFQPKTATNTLRPGWIARWLYAGIGGASVVGSVTGSGGSGMTPGTYPLSFTNTGTGGSGEAGTITVLTATTYTIQITAPGSGFTSAPTVTAATGGTPPTLTAHLATAGTEVANGANLSAESVQFLATGGDY